MLLLQFFSLISTFRKPIQEHLSRLKRVSHRCYFDFDTHRDLQDSLFVEDSNNSETDEFVIRGKIVHGVTLGHLILGSFGKVKKVPALVDTGSHNLVATGAFAVEPLTRVEANKYFESHMSEYNLLQICPAGFEKFFCTEANYGSASYLTALAKTEVFLHERNSFSVFLEYILGNTDHSPEYFKENEILSIAGAGYQHGDFTTNNFLAAAVDKLQKKNSKKVPKTFTLRFVENRFEAVVGAQVEESEFVWIPLCKNYWNTTIAKGLWAKSKGESVQLFGETEVLFDTGSNVVSIPQRYFTGFRKGLDRVVTKTSGCFIEEDEKYSNIFYFCASSNFVMETQLVFGTGAVMVLNFADFLVFDSGDYKCAVVIGEKGFNVTVIGLSAWRGFDFMLDGDRNRLGFKPNENQCKFCSVSEGRAKNNNN